MDIKWTHTSPTSNSGTATKCKVVAKVTNADGLLHFVYFNSSSPRIVRLCEVESFRSRYKRIKKEPRVRWTHEIVGNPARKAIITSEFTDPLNGRKMVTYVSVGKVGWVVSGLMSSGVFERHYQRISS